jgi:phage gp45-like
MSFNEHDDMVRSVIRRARVMKVYDDGTQQKIDLAGLREERPEKIVRVLPHGFTSNPNREAEGVMIQLGGRSDRTLFFGGEHKDHRQKNLKEGQAVLYDDKGNVIFAKGNDGISVNAKKGVVEIRSQDDKVTVTPGSGKDVYLGGDGTEGTYARVATEEGISMNVYARVS